VAQPTFSGGDLRVAAGIAGNAMMIEIVSMLWAKKIFSDDEMLTIITGAVDQLREMNEVQPHPAWVAAQNLLKSQAPRFGGPDPRSKPS
jgi:hypothetical protein